MVKTRYALLDELRGLTVLVMIAYHAVWDMVYVFGVKLPWFQSEGAYIWQQWICWTFIFISGMCQHFGRRRARRAALVFALGAVITAATWLVMPSNVIVFGILTLIGSAKLICLAAEPALRRCPPWAGAALSLAAFLLTRRVDRGYLGLGAWRLVELPRALYANYLTAFFGFPGREFFSADYFPLLPWVFLFLCGYFAYRLAEEHRLLRFLEAGRCRALEWLGRKTLWVYMAHQPLLYGVLWCVFAMVRG